MEAVLPACPSCGHTFSGKFCSNCGEKRVSEHDFTVGHFVEESVEGITHFDNKFLRSVRALWKPGLLTVYFEQGRKVNFMKPVQIFVICNVLFFLFAGKSNVFSQQLGTFLDRDSFRDFFLAHVGKAPDMAHYRELFLEKMNGQSKALIFLFLPMYALFTALVFWRKRKPLGLHLVFATHYFGFLLFFFALFGLLIEWPYHHWKGYTNAFENFAIVFNFTAIAVYFVLAARRFFQVRWWWALTTGLGAGAYFVLVLQCYRDILFFNIVRTLH